MNLITASISNYPAHLPVRLLSIDRYTLAKRRWRARADDGVDFGFDLQEPLRHRDVFHLAAGCVYAIAQRPENVLAIAITSAPQAARVGWQIGNLHFPLAFEDDCALASDDPAIRQLLEREHIPFTERLAVFTPIAAGSNTAHVHGPGHDHDHDHRLGHHHHH